MNVNNDPRRAAFEALSETEKKSGYLNIILPEVMDRYGLSDKDRSLCAAIAKGVVERKRTLEYVTALLSDLPLEKIDKRISLLLKIGTYQILYMDKIPPFAACNETVKIASGVCGKKAVGFLNGILRNAVRKKEELAFEIKNATAAVRYSVSDDLYEMFVSQYGDEKAEEILSRFYAVQPLCLRVNTLSADRESLIKKLSSVKLSVCPVGSNGVAVYGGGEKTISSMAVNGDYYIQGFSSQLAVDILNAKENDLVIDLCACPGGKSFGAAIDMKNKGKVISFDIRESKLKLIKKTAERLGISIIQTFCADSTVYKEEYAGCADKVVCDVPCSGTGSIGKRPEIRYKTAPEIDALTGVQYKILENGVGYLKNGGTLVYSVCSLNKAEGEYLIKRYLAEHICAELLEEKTVFPEKDGYDGFYIAKLIKKENG